MLPEIEKILAASETGVLSTKGSDGYPYSIRCRPRQDSSAGVLRLDLSYDHNLKPGPASLLFHSHDEKLWNQKVLLVLGRFEVVEDGHVFKPERSVGGIGFTSAVRMMFGARRTAAAYLKKRGLPRPRIPWNEIEAIKR